MIILKVTKNQGFTLSLENKFLEKPCVENMEVVDLVLKPRNTILWFYWMRSYFIHYLHYLILQVFTLVLRFRTVTE